MKIEIEGNKLDFMHLSDMLRSKIFSYEEAASRYNQKEIELTRKIILAYYGHKYSSLRGWHKITPYQLTTENKAIAKEILEIQKEIEYVRGQRKIAMTTMDTIKKAIDYYPTLSYTNLDSQIAEEWEKLIKVFLNFNVNVDISEIDYLVRKIASQ